MTDAPSSGFPRPLRAKERDLLATVLPGDRPGYRRLRDEILRMAVLAQGRRGEGDLVLGAPGDIPDLNSPLPPVIAYGMVEGTRETFSVTVREAVADQVNIEIVSNTGGEIPDHYEEKRRWTYSTWSPGLPSPATGRPVRELAIDSFVTLAFADAERRLWVHDAETGIVHLIPITNYYNELMLHKGIRDPARALASSLLWRDLSAYSDADLRAAFIAYNRVKHRVEVVPGPVVPPRRGIGSLLKKFFARKE